MDKNDLEFLALESVKAMLAQTPVGVTRHKDMPRDGFPLPIKRQAPDDDGFVRQQYRPLAILEYVNDVLSGENASRQARQRKSAQEQEK